MKLIVYVAILFFTALKYNGIAPVEENSTIYVFLDQKFQSEVCEAEDAPVWRINSTDLISATHDIQRYYGQVLRDYDDATGKQQATLILNRVNSTFNSSVISCTAGSTLILTYTLVVMNTTIKWVALHENFTTPICKSPLTESRAPYWMIDGDILVNTSVNSGYGAVVTRNDSDSRGRHQAQLTLHSMIKIQNGSNISCAVGSELRMVYILYIIPEQEKATPGSTVQSEEVVVEAINATEAKTSSNTAVIAGFVSGLVIVAVLVLGVIVAMYAFNTRKRQYIVNRLVGRVAEREHPEIPEEPEDDIQHDGVIPRHPSDNEREGLLHRPSVRRDAEIGEGEILAEGQVQDVKPHCENISTEWAVSGSTSVTNQGILEMSQGQEHATAIVFEDKVHLQGMPDKPLKLYLTEDDLPRTGERNEA